MKLPLSVSQCKRIFLFFMVVLFSLSIMSCVPKKQVVAESEKWVVEQFMPEKYIKPKPNESLEIAKKISKNASVEDIRKTLSDLIPEIGSATRGQIYLVYGAIGILKEKPNIVKAFAKYYKEIPKRNFHHRYLTLQVLGELRRPDSLELMKSIVWEPFPPIVPGPADRTTEQEYQERLQMKAVQGIAFTRNNKGSIVKEADEEILRIAETHASKAVRVSAIDAYMWNHGDTEIASAKLYNLLPREYHKYIEKPRFHKGVHKDTFVKRVSEWREKWAK